MSTIFVSRGDPAPRTAVRELEEAVGAQLPADYNGFLVEGRISSGYEAKVYLWSHEWEADEGEPPTYDNLTVVADSFASLIERIKPGHS
ncbi:MAG: hypothetical protein M3179_14985 [Actinomycetota bacterium]|nr:hypothetical protein [Actinomycetota bacterium]